MLRLTSTTTSKTVIFTKNPSEYDNHLGNVLAVISDQWKTRCASDSSFVGYSATLIQANDYSAFGVELINRTYKLNTPLWRKH